MPCSFSQNITKIVAFSFLLSTSFLSCESPSYTKEEGFMLRRISEFWKDQDYETVKKEIKSFLATHKNSKFCEKLHGNYADLLLQEGNYESALTSYEMISDPQIKETFIINKMQCYYELDRFADILSAGEPFLTQMSKNLVERKDEFYFLMAEGYFRSAIAMDKSEKKNTLLNKATPLYEKILNSSFNDPSMFSLAEIYRLQSINDKAYTLFLELSTRHPERKEELLFHAALAQGEFDKAGAIQTFSTIVSLNGLKQKDAALNRLILFFQEERFDDVITHYQETLDLIDKDKQSTLNYIIARSFFAKKSYDKATLYLGNFIANNQGSENEKRNALLMQLSTAQFLKNEMLYRQTLNKLEQFFPQDKELSQAVFIHAMMLKEKGDSLNAEKKLSSLLKDKNFKDKEILRLEYGLVAYNNENWKLSKESLQTFLAKYTHSNHLHVAWKYYLSSCLNYLRVNQDSSNPDYENQEFLADLERILENSKYLDEAERTECLFLQGKMHYSLENYDGSKEILSKFICSYSHSKHIAEAHLLLALCHHKGQNENDLFCAHAEKALSLDPTLAKKGALHLELFNVYLAISEASEHKNQLLNKASTHLYAALKLGENSICLSNKLWLCNHFLQKVAADEKIYLSNQTTITDVENFNKCFSLFQDVLLHPETNALKEIAENNTSLEWEVIKLANLFEKKGNVQKKISLLQSLIENQSMNKDWSWEAKEEALFEIAKAYESMHQDVKALETYQFINQAKSDEKTFVSEYARLMALKLEFAMLDQDQQTEQNQDVIGILSNLKNMQIQKSVSSEPLHLEAALEYAKIRGLISNKQDAHVKYQFYLSRITENFTSKNDEAAIFYQSELKKDQHMKHLYAQYTKFISAENYRMEAIAQIKDNHRAVSIELNNKASQLYKTLEKENTSPYLAKRIQESLMLLNKGKIF